MYLIGLLDRGSAHYRNFLFTEKRAHVVPFIVSLSTGVVIEKVPGDAGFLSHKATVFREVIKRTV